MIRWIFTCAIAAVLFTALPAFGWMAFSLSQPFDTLADNTVVDIVYDGTYVWLATGNGLSGTRDNGATWRSFNSTNGFTRSSVSALAATGSRLWVATSHDTASPSSGELVPAGGGVQITDNFGDDWRLAAPKSLSSPGMLAYDLAPYDSSIWAACFYGGLLRSLDRGETWQNIFVDTTLKNDFEGKTNNLLAGRYFSALVDPYHDDSVIVWAGTAEGVQRLYYIGKHKKLASNRINDIAFDGKFWWYATDRGLTKFSDSLFIFNTYDADNGLPGNFVSAVGADGDLICAGLYDTLSQQSLGFVVSTNGGSNWQLTVPEQAVGANKMIQEIAINKRNGDVWAACGEGGVIRLGNRDRSWHRYYLDSNVTTIDDPRNIAHSVHITDRDSVTKVFVGTDSGIVVFRLHDRSVPDSVFYLPLQDDTANGQKVVSISTMVTANGDEIWAATHLLRQGEGLRPGTIRSINNGESWSHHLIGPPAIVPTEVRIVEQFKDTLVWVATESGMRESIDFGAHWNTPLIASYPDTIKSSDRMLAVEATSEQTHVGSRSKGAGYLALYGDSTLGVLYWTVLKANLVADSLDLVGRSYVMLDSVPSDSQIAGNFIPAMGLQHRSDKNVIWAAVRSTDTYQYNGICITSNRGRTWKLVADGAIAWNFEFNGDTVWAATSGGLLMTTDEGANWRTLKIVEKATGREIGGNVEVYAARYVNGALWVGTNDGVARSVDLEDWQIWRVFYPIAETAADDERSYVTPNPFSPYLSDGPLKFHYRLKQSGNITINVYDFANNLVKTVASGVSRDGVVQYDDFERWDGRNGKGDIVAGGVYLYIIESSGGDKLSGKFMVIP
jgi:hypothetical protein